MPGVRDWPISYYTHESGIGVALDVLGQQGPLRVGVIGLGIGTIAAYGRPGDVYRFYEINPLVPKIAQQYFWYLADNPARLPALHLSRQVRDVGVLKSRDVPPQERHDRHGLAPCLDLRRCQPGHLGGIDMHPGDVDLHRAWIESWKPWQAKRIMSYSGPMQFPATGTSRAQRGTSSGCACT